jgi:hypothetical protein
MTLEEASSLLGRILGAERYIEWGSGGSTELVAYLILAGHLGRNFRAWTIESSRSWLMHLRSRSRLIYQAEATGQLQLLIGDIGPTGHLGWPVKRPSHTVAKRYVNAIDTIGLINADVILVDGRYRLACMLSALKYMEFDDILLLHDFAIRPPGLTHIRYQRIADTAFRYFRKAAQNDTLAAFQPRMRGNRRVSSADFEHSLQYIM